ncbi:MAG: hypothetical protein DSY46_00340 [Hydrogenimonas sp.]|nr:MAG: hypothetical protein DSY46_00340 [Hydrogenimonas sp.]
MRAMVMGVMVATALFAGECRYSVKDIGVAWSAYKTPLRVAVGGTFHGIKLQARPDQTVDALLEGAHVTIDTATIYSKNRARDAKLVKFFFDVQGVKTISAEIKSLHKDIADVEIEMNGISKTIPMKLVREENRIEAEGYLDLGDFEMLPALQSINKACYDLHKGKTWQDIKITFEIETKKRCQ